LLAQRIKCVRVESGCLGMIKECLLYLLHAPRGPVYSPKRQLGAVGGNFGRQILPSAGWRTGLSGAPLDCPVRHRTVLVAVWCAISFLF
jgi:hypothetical protein